MDLKLQVLICTFARGIEKIDAGALPRLGGVRYLISCQNPENLDLDAAAEKLSLRGDTDVIFSNTRGLSINRNIAFDNATAPYLLIADDDLKFYPEGLMAVMDAFDSDPELDIATFRSHSPAERVFPPHGHDLAESFRFYYAISFEIAVRRDFLLRKNLRFSPLAGIGAPVLGSGEEDLFLHHAIKAGAKGRFFNIPVVLHAGPTTAEHSAVDPRVLTAKGACLPAIRGIATALSRYPVEAWRSKAPFFKALYYYCRGFVYYIRHRDEL